MPVNPELLELSVQKCYAQFLDYFHVISKFSKFSLSFWEGKTDWDSIVKIEDSSNRHYSKNVLEIEWQCTKNTPSTGKLRFFLALYLSSKDLERCGDYLYSICKLTNKDKKKELRRIVLNSELWSLLLSYFRSIYSLFRSSTGKIEQEAYQEILSQKSFMHSQLSKIGNSLSEQLLSLRGLDLLSEIRSSDADSLKPIEELLDSFRLLQLLLVKIDRFLDHVFNIVENFYYIKNQEIGLSLQELLGERHLSD
ncbi:phosphate transporter protein PhoU [Candidatus Mycoplasma haematolamae str. Purdue]|uniref:Phosphate transporter protein PhoU n=1 Tax=Mycoplasma haematolamae (strain Purdue) TaxID=1212765 RepID=I7CEG9_MYCHA|nr:PhoU family transcriptional regulator [Candidatus Mycoplasma haematolamae]AFO51631.1 phosphate transporter protein PhoU [Candidatus Mycoplasma haematolamae str. Purdue]